MSYHAHYNKDYLFDCTEATALERSEKDLVSDEPMLHPSRGKAKRQKPQFQRNKSVAEEL
jgi:hypothetical protein